MPTRGPRASLSPPAFPATHQVALRCARSTRQSWGRRLALAIIDEARAICYGELKLDTLARMTAAVGLYQSLGFVESEAYYHNPLGSPVYMTLSLVRDAR